MSIWIPTLNLEEGHRYRVLAESIRTAIAIGDLQPGEKLLAHRQMAWKLGVTIGTVARAYSLATQWGLLEARVGHGTRVCIPGREEGLITWGSVKDKIDLGLLIPSPVDDPDLQTLAFEKSFASLGDSFLLNSLSAYAPEFGYPAHRQAGAKWLEARGLPTAPRNIVISHGAQEAFLLILNLFAKAGDSILAEEFTYHAFKNLCAALTLQMQPVAMDNEGMIATSLAEAASHSGARIVFICPTLQNPTGATMSERRRQAIAETARQHDLLIIETDPFWNLVEKCPPAISLFAPERSFYVSSLSKYVSPSIRLAYMKVADEYVDRIEKTKHALTISGPSLRAEIATQWINSGVINDLCRWQKQEIRSRSLLAREVLGPHFPSGQESHPFLWLALPEPWRAAEFLDAARLQDIVCIDAERCAVGRGQAPHTVRLALTSPKSQGILREALQKIRRILEGATPPIQYG